LKKRFYEDLSIIYGYISRRNRRIGGFYKAALSDKKSKKRDFLDTLLKSVGLKADRENRMAAAIRIADLREDSLTQALKAYGADEKRIIEAKELSFEFVAEYYLKKHRKLLKYIEKKELLTPFYRELLKGVHETGEAFSTAHTSWTATIINGVNRELFEMFNGDEEKIFEMLRRENLIDLGHDASEADRTYSVLVHNGKRFESVPYSQAFKEEVKSVTKSLKKTLKRLECLEDEVFGQKGEYIEYFKAIVKALKEKEPRKAVRIGDEVFSFGEQKAFLTEIWMSSGALFAGDTRKDLEARANVQREHAHADFEIYDKKDHPARHPPGDGTSGKRRTTW